MAELEHKVVEIIDKLQSLATPAMHAAIDSTRISGILYLVVGVACGIVCYLLSKTLPGRLKALKETKQDCDEFAQGIALIAMGVSTVGFGIATCVNLLNPDNWLAAIRPDLYLAQILLHHI